MKDENEKDRLRTLGWAVQKESSDHAAIIVKGDLEMVVVLQVGPHTRALRSIVQSLTHHSLFQSCDDFLSGQLVLPASGSMSHNTGVKWVTVQWCRFKNCSVSSSTPPPSSTDCSFGSCPVALTRDIVPSIRDTSHNSRPTSCIEDNALDGIGAQDACRVSKEHLSTNEQLQATGADLDSKKATTVVVVPYRNRTKALTLLVRAKRHVCDDDKMMLTKLLKITISS